MKFKVGDKIFDGNVEPVMVILTEQDKKNISMMEEGASKYCMFPDTFTAEEMRTFMKTDK